MQCEDDEKFEAPVECAQCVVPVPQSGETPASEVAQNTEATPETVARDIGTETRETEDDDDFRSVEGSYHLCAGCRGFYYRMADSLSGGKNLFHTSVVNPRKECIRNLGNL